MTPDRWQHVKEALDSALARDPDGRAAYLDEIAAADPSLRREVEDLLAYRPAEDFLEQPAVPNPTLTPGVTFGPYQIHSQLGEGGMGQVFLAQDRTLDRPVALKFLSSALQEQEEARRRFLREAKAAAALDHPYICKIYQTGEEDGRPFIAMEYVRGETLRSRLDTERLPLKDVLRITMEVAEALETAHAAPIVHRDLKPSNIMLTTGGHVKVLDFGLAKRVVMEGGDHAETQSELTEAGAVQGTVAYMSPEQVRGRKVDSRSDVFSLGVVLYECLTGRNPFQAGSSLETASQILHHTPPSPGLGRDDVPPLLEHIVTKMLAKAPEDRYQATHDLRTDLARVRDMVDRGEAPTATGKPSTGPEILPVAPGVVRPAFRRRALISGLVLALGVTAGASLWWWSRAEPGVNRAPLSVAVMPFANVSGDPDNDYLANGIAQAVTTRLHRAGLRVIPWETARRFRDSSNPIEIARALKVDAVLSGSFQTAGDRLLVTVSLVEGATGFISWTNEFEEAFDDIFQVQTRIAEGVAANLGHELTGDAAATLARPESSSLDAYDFYLQGAEYLQNGDRESTNIAYDYFSRAVKVDPNMAEARVGLGAVYLERYWSGWGGGAGNLGLAEKSFQTALQHDPMDMRARRGLMLIEFYRGNSEEALRLAQEAALRGSDDIETLLARAEAYALSGPTDPAGPLLDRILALDPGNQTASWLRVLVFHRNERFGETVTAADDYVRRFGDDPFVVAIGANASEKRGDLEGARERYDQGIERLLQSSSEPGFATAYGLTLLLRAGVFHHRNGRPDRAQALWKKGLQLTRDVLVSDAESPGLQLFLASFHGFLGERPAFEKEEAAAVALIKRSGLNPWELVYLAEAHKHLGNTERALTVLRNQLRAGRVTGWSWLSPVAPIPRGTPRLDEFLREYDVEVQRLRTRYVQSP